MISSDPFSSNPRKMLLEATTGVFPAISSPRPYETFNAMTPVSSFSNQMVQPFTCIVLAVTRAIFSKREGRSRLVSVRRLLMKSSAESCLWMLRVSNAGRRSWGIAYPNNRSVRWFSSIVYTAGLRPACASMPVRASRRIGTASRRTRLIVHPPNPPPVIRAPSTPLFGEQRARVGPVLCNWPRTDPRRLAWERFHQVPEVFVRSFQQGLPSMGHSFVFFHHVVEASLQGFRQGECCHVFWAHVTQAEHVRSGSADGGQGAKAFGAAFVVPGCRQPACETGIGNHQCQASLLQRQGDVFAFEGAAVSRRACPRRPILDVNGSMMPQATPAYRCSTRWHRRAVSTGSRFRSKRTSSPYATPTKSAAEELSPAPTGTSPWMSMSNPARTWPFRWRLFDDAGDVARPVARWGCGSFGTRISEAILEILRVQINRPVVSRPEEHGYPTVDRDRQHVAVVVIGVVSDQVCSAGGPHHHDAARPTAEQYLEFCKETLDQGVGVPPHGHHPVLHAVVRRAETAWYRAASSLRNIHLPPSNGIKDPIHQNIA